MSYKCLIDSTTKVVINIIELKDDAIWQAPSNTELAPQHNGNIGDVWNGSEFVKPVNEENLQENSENDPPNVIV